MIRLLHLSDIHFNRHSSKHYDLDKHIRDLLVQELKSYSDKNGKFYRCLITGDIVFSGNQEEYDKAHEFLNELSNELDFPPGAFWVVPGNHDYNRKIAGETRTVSLALDKFRSCSEKEINKEISVTEEKADSKDLIYSPLAAYNKFAKEYNCQIGPGKSFWETKIPLTDEGNIFLNIRGLNSVIVSSDEDNHENDNTRMVMNLTQCQLLKKTDSINLTLCHHPLEWIRNHRELGDNLNAGANIQLYGHEHDPRLTEINQSVVVHAGALHPERDYAAMPSYNILEFDSQKARQEVTIKLTITCRKFNNKSIRFDTIPHRDGPDHEYYYQFNGKDFPKFSYKEREQVKPLNPKDEKTPESFAREMAYRSLLIFISDMDFIDRFNILKDLGLMGSEDKEAFYRDEFIFFVEKARDKNLLKELWGLVTSKTPGQENSTNPFE